MLWSATAIPLHAQIIGIVDVYDALTTTRSYRNAMSHTQATDLMRSDTFKGSWRDDVVAAFAVVSPQIEGRTRSEAGRGDEAASSRSV